MVLRALRSSLVSESAADLQPQAGGRAAEARPPVAVLPVVLATQAALVAPVGSCEPIARAEREPHVPGETDARVHLGLCHDEILSQPDRRRDRARSQKLGELRRRQAIELALRRERQDLRDGARQRRASAAEQRLCADAKPIARLNEPLEDRAAVRELAVAAAALRHPVAAAADEERFVGDPSDRSTDEASDLLVELRGLHFGREQNSTVKAFD